MTDRKVNQQTNKQQPHFQLCSEVSWVGMGMHSELSEGECGSAQEAEGLIAKGMNQATDPFLMSESFLRTRAPGQQFLW